MSLNTEILKKIEEVGQGVVDMSIILVGWNNKPYLEPCLESLYADKLNCSFDVVVVDNGSTDGSQEMLREKFPEVMLIQNAKNVGLSKASNQGIISTEGRFILLLNNDTIVNGPSLDAMVSHMNENPQVGAVGCKLLNDDGTTQSCFNNFSTFKEEFLIATRLGEVFRTGYPSIVDSEEVQSVDWMSSACLLLRRSALDQVGFLDEEYFIYGDEADLQFRIKKAGWDIYYLPQARIIHYGGRSMDRWRRRKMVYRGKMLFYKKNYGLIKSYLLRFMLGILSLVKIFFWGLAYLIPSKRDRAHKELSSNFDVIQICINLT